MNTPDYTSHPHQTQSNRGTCVCCEVCEYRSGSAHEATKRQARAPAIAPKAQRQRDAPSYVLKVGPAFISPHNRIRFPHVGRIIGYFWDNLGYFSVTFYK